MTHHESGPQAISDPEGYLEDALIQEFLRARGLDSGALHGLPQSEVKRVLTEASVYAAVKLAEVEARAHFVQDIHGRE